MTTTTFNYESFEAFSPFVGIGPYRATDYWQLPEGEPVELIEGRFVTSPSPNWLHQTIVMVLAEKLLGWARKSGGAAAVAPMDVVLSDDSIVQPDLLYVARDRRGIIKERVYGSPDLVIEIVSDNSRRDRVVKLDLYARYGVAEYWIVDPQSQLIEFLINEGGRYVVQSPANDRYQSPRLPEVEIELADFWHEVDARLPSV